MKIFLHNGNGIIPGREKHLVIVFPNQTIWKSRAQFPHWTFGFSAKVSLRRSRFGDFAQLHSPFHFAPPCCNQCVSPQTSVFIFYAEEASAVRSPDGWLDFLFFFGSVVEGFALQELFALMFPGTQVISVVTVNLHTCNGPFLFCRVFLSLKSTEVRISYVLVLLVVRIQVILVVRHISKLLWCYFFRFFVIAATTLTFLMFFKDSYISCVIISDSWTYILVFHHRISEHPDECVSVLPISAPQYQE